MFFHSLAHLFVQVLLRWISFLGTSPAGIIAQVSIVVITEARSGWWRLSAWRQNWQGGLRRALYALVGVWIVAFFVCTVTTLYDDHRALVDSNGRFAEENSLLRK